MWSAHRRSFLLALLSPLASLAAQPDPLDIIRRSVGVATDNIKRSRNYTFLQRTEEIQRGPNAEVKSKTSKTWDITMLEGSSYRRLV